VIAGGPSGQVWAYDTATGDLVASFKTDLVDQPDPVFINDLAATRNGDVYVTDSFGPVIYRIDSEAFPQESTDPQPLEVWLDLEGSPIEYGDGFNLNGIVVTPDDRYLLTVQSNTGKLYRIDLETQAIEQVDLGDAVLSEGDGLVLQGHTLYVVDHEGVVQVRLSGDWSEGEVVGKILDESFAYPTTAAEGRGRLYVVNSQFDRQGPPDTSEQPFTLSVVRLN